jgi:hypothetical protein
MGEEPNTDRSVYDFPASRSKGTPKVQPLAIENRSHLGYTDEVSKRLTKNSLGVSEGVIYLALSLIRVKLSCFVGEEDRVRQDQEPPS